MRHGQGKFFYQDGGMYDGNWSKNKMDGIGALYYQSGKLAYQGMWKEDQFDGSGKLCNEYPRMLCQEFNFRNLDEIDDYW
jgi:antitoxin component YwqK of YwqJK toxin-antitoxin module